MSRIVSVKLVSGEEIIGRLEDANEKFIILYKPIKLHIVPQDQNKIGLMPELFVTLGILENIELNMNHVMCICDAREEFANWWNVNLGNGLTIPQKSLVLPN